jgi:hypothetical protein
VTLRARWVTQKSSLGDTKPSAPHCRRAEFRVWHQGDQCFYAMFHPSMPKGPPVRVDQFPMGSEQINQLMPLVMQEVHSAGDLFKKKLFQVELTPPFRHARSKPSGTSSLYRGLHVRCESLGVVYRSFRAIVCRPVPNPTRPIRTKQIAAW